ncbi:MAG: hypothetical protein ABIJ00_09315 [Candidatus Eisenbacteria bacterium]
MKPVAGTSGDAGGDMAGKTVCEFCGRRAKRHCPAIRAYICTPCCGSKRGTDLKCASDCRFYPFAIAAYDTWLNLDESLMHKVVKHVVSTVGEMHLGSVEDSFAMEGASSMGFREEVLYLTVQHCLFGETNEEGRTLADKWRDHGWVGLRPDEAAIMRYRSRSFVTIVEIQKVVDHQTMECVDLFDPENRPFILLDRSLARAMTRFTRIIGWLTHYPHFSKLGHFSHEVPQLVHQDFIDLIRRGAEQEWKDAGLPDCRGYMTRHLPELLPALLRMPGEKMAAIFKNMDSYHCLAVYALTGRSSSIRQILEAKPDFAWDDREPDEGDPPDVEYYSWRRLGESQEIEKEMPSAFRHDTGSEWIGSLGNLTLYRDKFVFEAFTKRNFEFGKKMIRRYFGKAVRFENEEISEIAGKIADEHEEGTPDLNHRDSKDLASESIPPEVKAEMARKFFHQHYTSFLDDHVPALNGMTPREASRKPEARPLLVDLMKDHIHGIERRNRDEGLDINIDFVLRELGLEELID